MQKRITHGQGEGCNALCPSRLLPMRTTAVDQQQREEMAW